MGDLESQSVNVQPIQANVLVVEDEAPLLEMATMVLVRYGHKIWTAQTVNDARDVIESNPIEIVLTDLTLEKENDGITLLNELVLRAPDIATIIMTGNHDVQTAIQCLRNGAFDYLLKPFDFKELAQVVNRVAERRKMMIEQRNRVEEQLRILGRFPSENPNPVLRVRTDGTLLYANMASMPLLKEWKCDIGDSLPAFLKDFVSETIKAEQQRDIEVEGNGRVFSFTVTPIKDSNYVYIYGHDITRLKEIERELTRLKNQAQEMALHDALTELPNRILLEDRLELAIKQSLRNGTKTALVFIDVDNFKRINDTYGHKIGDQVLVKLGQYLSESVRKTDTVARWGGDEMILLLTGLHNREEARFVCERIRRDVQEKMRQDKSAIPVTLSMGVAICPDDAQNADTLEQQADTALYVAKARGRNIVVLFSDTDYVRTFQQKAHLGNLLQKAIEDTKIFPHYQPIIESKSGSIVAVEALARWFEPELGWIPPSTFIPMAEEAGLIESLGEKIAFRAIEDLKKWRDNNLNVTLNLNVSLKQLYTGDFINKLVDVVNKKNLQTSWITLEITESQALVGSLKRGSPIEEAAGAGFRLSIDDFGQGYSSLSSLQEMSVHELKIDMKFVRNIKTQKGALIVQAIVELARILGLETVGEGVEDKDEFNRLLQIGVSRLQGYYIARPMPFEEVNRLLRLPNLSFILHKVEGASNVNA
ncbi:MAG: EAL domain-containing protein [Verrucomicrobiia bacterium]